VKPVLGDPPRDSAAAVAGLANGDTVRAVGDESVHSWTDVRWLLLKEAVRRGVTPIEVDHGGRAAAPPATST
jgi:regulator of sigma E protease